MADLSNQTYCYFCQRELNTGEGRYRFFQREKEVECCPSCFDQMRAFPPQSLVEPSAKQPAAKTEGE